jgi:hypothetical protein
MLSSNTTAAKIELHKSITGSNDQGSSFPSFLLKKNPSSEICILTSKNLQLKNTKEKKRKSLRLSLSHLGIGT